MIIVLSGVNFDTGARNAFAGEMIFLSFDKNDFTVDGSMNREVTAHESARTSKFGCASLANENFTGFNGLATKAFDAEALAGIVMDVFTGTASFDM